MDPYTQNLVERTRQRRELLNQKFGKTPEPAPRKRILEDTRNVQHAQPSTLDDDSPKRQRVREAEHHIKPDTPAIPSVKSRLHHIADEKMAWSDSKKVQSAACHQPQFSSGGDRLAAASTNRKSRFAKLAQNLDNFECDMSHPSVKKSEEKPRWQPPRDPDQSPNRDARDRHVSSPRKEYELYQGPTRTNNRPGSPAASPKRKHAPAPPSAPSLSTLAGDAPVKPPRCASPLRAPSPMGGGGSPKVSTYKMELQPAASQPSSRFVHQVRQVGGHEPVNARPHDDDEEPMAVNAPVSPQVSQKLGTWRGAGAHSRDSPGRSVDPTQLPLSERFAGWEQRVNQTPQADTVSSSKVKPTPKQTCTPARENPGRSDGDPADKPVSDIRTSWQNKDAQNNPRKPDEPTAYSVSDRMSAWEVLSSSNKVSYAKKVDPSNSSPRNSPTRPAGQGLKSSGTPNKPDLKPSGTPGKSWKPAGTPGKGLTPQKSFKESIEERASQMGRRPAGGEGLPPKAPAMNGTRSPVKSTGSPVKSHNSPSRADQRSPSQLSPTVKVGSATKSLQQRLLEQTAFSKTDALAERIRQERMAEVNALNNRNTYKGHSETDSQDEGHPISQPAVTQSTKSPSKRDTIRSKARQDFNSKMKMMGFEISDEDVASYNFTDQGQSLSSQDSSNAPPAPPPPPAPANLTTSEKLAQRQGSSASNKPSSIYRLVSKKCSAEEKPVTRQKSNASLKKVTFEAYATESDSSIEKHVVDTQDMDDTEDFDPPSEEIQSETQESFDDSYDSATDSSSIPESYKGEASIQNLRPVERLTDEDDDVSMSAFVPDSVRRASVLPSGPAVNDDDTCSISSEDNLDNRSPYAGRSTLHGGYRQERQYGNVNDTTDDDSEEEGADAGDIDALLDEAMDDVCEVEMRHKEPQAAPRKRRSHAYATTQGEMQLPSSSVETRSKSDGLAYSVSMYRNNRSTTIQTTVNFQKNSQDVTPVSQRYSRNSHYTHEKVIEEEDVQMPRELPLEVQRKTIDERVQELKELVNQEQSVIMQTSNALNKCCSGDSVFAGSTEQVECNRLLLVSCQRRQAYLMEIQRLRDTGRLESANEHGPKGSLTISDIRLPLKKDFVTKIGTPSDNTVHYFVILIRNGPQVILTQMLSTHDPMMRGSLDFPNLIKIHGISASFDLTLEIYSMSVSREAIKEKKKKTPKKSKYSAMPLESPGGPTAVRTTSFTLITTVRLTMKSLDKNSFSLERISYNSPLHGMIYMRLKCMMEQNVEEKGFLTMFEDVSGLGSWHRRWCVLSGNRVGYWKYPDDESRKEPMGLVDLKRCITEKVGLIPRDICARPNTFELVAVRPPRRGEQDTLVTKTYNTMTTTKFMLSADTKEERIVWCNKINRALANIRTWHADAMRPISSKR